MRFYDPVVNFIADNRKRLSRSQLFWDLSRNLNLHRGIVGEKGVH